MKIKIQTYIASVLLVIGLLAFGGLYLAKFRPQVIAIPVAEIDAVAQQTGVADCFWFAPFKKGGLNYAFIDEGATYWVTKFQLPQGAALEFTGNYPHARYLSFVTYDENWVPLNNLTDSAIQPDSGSVNPFVSGAQRDAVARSYRFRAVKRADASTVHADKDGRNTLYLDDGKGPSAMIMRIYVPDKGMDARGGVSLPKPVMRLADGTSVEGDALCHQIVIKEGAAKYVQLPTSAVKTLYQLKSDTTPYHPAQPTPLWEAFRNPPYVVSGAFTGTALAWTRKFLAGSHQLGMLATPDNSYMYSYIDSRFGDLLVLHGKAPTTPHTFEGAKVMAPGQLRYWSMCKYHSLANTQLDPNACVYDEEIRANKQGEFTIVVSTAANRPSNASSECGIGWINWGDGDGIDNSHGGLILYRNMLPAADFANSIFSVRDPGEEAATLGDYYPKAQYTDKQTFEKLGCSKSA